MCLPNKRTAFWKLQFETPPCSRFKAPSAFQSPLKRLPTRATVSRRPPGENLELRHAPSARLPQAPPFGALLRSGRRARTSRGYASKSGEEKTGDVPLDQPEKGCLAGKLRTKSKVCLVDGWIYSLVLYESGMWDCSISSL